MFVKLDESLNWLSLERQQCPTSLKTFVLGSHESMTKPLKEEDIAVNV